MRFVAFSLAFVVPASAFAVGPDKAALEKTRAKAISFLKATQSEDGSWTSSNAPGIAGLVLASLLESGVKPDDATVAKGLKHLESFIRKDGGIYASKSKHRNYETCIAILAFEKANTKGKYQKTIDNAVKFLKKLQWDKGEGLESSDPAFGGAGYGSHERPDMSNTSFLIEALKKAGVKSDDPAMKAALSFASRTQNLESEHNTTPHAAKINDGGLYYTPAAGGESKAGITKNGGLRSYGSMTYAGLKSFIYAGLSEDDVRVKAAYKWIRKNYTLKENPGFVRSDLGQQGLYYYYHMFAKGLAALGKSVVVDDKGVKHDWRKELFDTLAKLQRSNGSWVNPASRWYEGDPNLVTGYALLALSHCEVKAFAENAALEEKMVAVLEEYAIALESVKDAESAKLAAKSIQAINDRFAELLTQQESLPKLTKTEDEKMKKAYMPRIQKASQRMRKAAAPAGAAGGTEPSFLAALKRMAEVVRRAQK